MNLHTSANLKIKAIRTFCFFKSSLEAKVNKFWLNNKSKLLEIANDVGCQIFPIWLVRTLNVVNGGYCSYNKIKTLTEQLFYYTENWHIEGLSADVQTKLFEIAEEKIQEFLNLKLKIDLDLFNKEQIKSVKKTFICFLLDKIFEKIPVSERNKINIDVINKSLSRGFLENFKQAGFFLTLDKWHDWIEPNLQISLITDRVLKNLHTIPSLKSQFFFDFIQESGGLYTLKLYSSGSDFVDLSVVNNEYINTVFEYKNIAKEKIINLVSKINQLEIGDVKTIKYLSCDIPDLIQDILNVEYQKKQIEQIVDEIKPTAEILFFRQKVLNEIFQGDKESFHQFQMSMEIAEVCLSINSEKSLDTKYKCYSYIQKIKILINTAKKNISYPDKSLHLKTLDQALSLAKKKLTLILNQETKTLTEQKNNFPPLVWQTLQAVVEFTGKNKKILDQIFIGLESCLEGENKKTINSLKKEYLSFVGESNTAGQKSKLYKLVAFSFCLFIQMFILDVLSVFLGFILAPATLIGKAFFKTTIAYSGVELKKRLPKELMQTYEEVWIEIISFFIPSIINFSYRYFINEKIKNEIKYRIEVFTALTIKQDPSEVVAEVKEDIDICDDIASTSVLNIEERALKSRLGFIEKIEKLNQIDEKIEIDSDTNSMWSFYEKNAIEFSSEKKLQIWKEILISNSDFSGIDQFKKISTLHVIDQLSNLQKLKDISDVSSFVVTLGTSREIINPYDVKRKYKATFKKAKNRILQKLNDIIYCSFVQNNPKLNETKRTNYEYSTPYIIEEIQRSNFPATILTSKETLDTVSNAQLIELPNKPKLVYESCKDIGVEYCLDSKYYFEEEPIKQKISRKKQVEVLNEIKRLGKIYLDSIQNTSIKKAEDLFIHFSNMEELYRDQMRFIFAYHFDCDLRKHILNFMLFCIQNGLTKDPFFYLEADDDIFKEFNSAQLSNYIFKITLWLTIINQSDTLIVSPKTYLALANLMYIEEFNIQKSCSTYGKIGFFINFLSKIKNHFSKDNWTDQQFKTLQRLVKCCQLGESQSFIRFVRDRWVKNHEPFEIKGYDLLELKFHQDKLKIIYQTEVEYLTNEKNGFFINFLSEIKNYLFKDNWTDQQFKPLKKPSIIDLHQKIKDCLVSSLIVGIDDFFYYNPLNELKFIHKERDLILKKHIREWGHNVGYGGANRESLLEDFIKEIDFKYCRYGHFRELIYTNFSYFTKQLFSNPDLLMSFYKKAKEKYEDATFEIAWCNVLLKKSELNEPIDLKIKILCSYYFPSYYLCYQDDIVSLIKKWHKKSNDSKIFYSKWALSLDGFPEELEKLYYSLDFEENEDVKEVEIKPNNSANVVKKIDDKNDDQDEFYEVLSEERIPAVIYPLTLGKRTIFLSDSKDIKTLEIIYKKDEKNNCKFQIKDTGILCLKPIKGNVTKTVYLEDHEVLKNPIFVEDGGNYFAVYYPEPWSLQLFKSLTSSQSIALEKNISFLMGFLVNIKDDLISKEQKWINLDIQSIKISKEGKLLPNTYQQYSQLIAYYYFKDDYKRSEIIEDLVRKIDLGEMNEEEFKFEYTLLTLLALEGVCNNPKRSRDLLYLSLVWLHRNEMSIIKKDNKIKTAILVALIPNYINYIQNEFIQKNPIPESLEAVFIMEAISLINKLVEDKPRALNQIVELFAPEMLFVLFSMYLSGEFNDRLKVLEKKYCFNGLKKSLSSSQIKKQILEYTKCGNFSRLIKSTLSFSYTTFNLVPSGCFSELIKAIAFHSLSNLQLSGFSELELSKSKDKLVSIYTFSTLQEKELRENFLFFASLLTLPEFEIARKYKLEVSAAESYVDKLLEKLDNTFIPKNVFYEAFWLLKKLAVDRKKPEFAFAPEYSKEFIEYLLKHKRELNPKINFLKKTGSDLVQFIKRSIPFIKRSIKSIPSRITEKDYILKTSRYFFNLIAPQYKQLIDVATVFFQNNNKKLEGVSDDVFFDAIDSFDDDSLKCEYDYLNNQFLKLVDNYFEKQVTPENKEFSFSLDYQGDIQSKNYFDFRVKDSFDALKTDADLNIKYTLKSEKNLRMLEIDLLILKSKLEKEIKLFTVVIEEAVNKKTKFPAKINELYSIILEKNAVEILKKRMNLLEPEADEVTQKIAILALYESYLTKVNLVIEEIQTNNLANIAAKLIEPKHYKIDHEDFRFALSCLIFEAKSKVWLRPLQATQIQKTIEKKEGSVVVEMIPGSGKTAFGIVLDLHYQWKKGFLPIAVFTQQLITSTKKDLADRFYKLTKRKAFTIEIERGKETVTSLKFILQRMKIAQEEGDVCITTKEQLQEIELILIENLLNREKSWFYEKKTQIFVEKSSILKEMLKIINSSSVVVDECHEILKPDEVLKYPVGAEQELSKDIILGVELVFKYLLKDLKNKNTSFKSFMEDPVLHIDDILNEIIKDDLLKFGESKKEELKNYIKDLSKDPPKWLKESSFFETVATIRGVLNELLPEAFKEIPNVSYGLSKKNNNQEFVIPYSGNNAPIEDSIFESPIESLVKTYLYFLNMSKEDFLSYAKILHRTILSNMMEEVKLKPLLEETKFEKFFIKYFGEKMPNWDKIEKSSLEEFRVLYVTLYVANSIKFYNESIEANAVNFSSMFKKAHYFSGTIYNQSVYPQKMTYVRSLDTTARTLEISSKQILESGKIIYITTQDEYIEELSKDFNCRMAIDAGALFNGIKNEEVAKKIGTKFLTTREDIKSVLFFDESNNMKVLSLSNFEILPYDPKISNEKELFCYLDQMHTFGVDIPQIEGTKSNITIGDNSLSEIEQAIWRLRGLETKNQSICLSILPKAKGKISNLRFEDVVQYLLDVEITKLKAHNLQAHHHKMADSLRSRVLKKIINNEIKSIPKEFIYLFENISCNDPKKLFGYSKQYRKPLEGLRDLIKDWDEKVEHSYLFTTSEKEKIQDELFDLDIINLQENHKIFPEKILVGGLTSKIKAKIRVSVEEKERQTEKQKERQTEKQKEFSRWFSKKTEYKQLRVDLDCPVNSFPEKKIVSLQMFVEEIEAGKHGFLKDLFYSSAMHISKNIINFSDDNFNEKWLIKNPAKLESVLIIYDKTNNSYATIGLVDNEDLLWLSNLNKHGYGNSKYSYGVCKLNLGTVCFRDQIETSIEDYYKSKEFKEQLMLWRILSRPDSLTLADLEIFESKINTDWKNYSIEEIVSTLENLWSIRASDEKSQKFLYELKSKYFSKKESCFF